MEGYGKIAWPMTQLLKKDSFGWNDAAEVAFTKLKDAMMTVSVLAVPDFLQPFVIETNASGYGLGAVLMQNQRPIGYFSQVLPPKTQNKSIYERELMAIVLAVQKWRHYLLGRLFVVRADQKNLKFLLDQRLLNVEYHKCLTKLLGFDFDIGYKSGSENKAADALSRKGVAATLMALSIPNTVQIEEVIKAV